jgi:hypothetical protein
MRAYVIKAGTEVKMVPKDTYASFGFLNIVDYKTQVEKMFFTEDIVIDPLGHVGSGPGEKTVGGQWAENGWYGFALADPEKYPHGDPDSRWYAVLVPYTAVEVN